MLVIIVITVVSKKRKSKFNDQKQIIKQDSGDDKHNVVNPLYEGDVIEIPHYLVSNMHLIIKMYNRVTCILQNPK